MAKRVLCKKPDCSNLILQTTADDNDGYCMPCVQSAARKEHEEYVRKHRRDVNEFEGVTDPVEVLKIVHKPRNYNQLVNWIPHPTPTDELYSRLTEVEKSRLASYAKELIGTERNEEAEEICLCVAAFCNADIDDCLRQFIANGSYWPSLAFYRSPPAIRDELLARVETDDDNRGHILQALAWIGDAVVVDRFKQWRATPPSWGESLYVLPDQYSREAGWELTSDGKRRDLYFAKCFALQQGPSRTPEAFRAIVERTDCCPWCSAKLSNLFEVDLTACELISDNEGNMPFQVVTCEVCTAFASALLGVTDDEGRAQWSVKNTRPDYLPDDSDTWDRLPSDSLFIGEPRSPIYAADQFLPVAFSQLGGHPTWIQDSVYPDCPECSKTMLFLAQIANEDIEEHAEGTFYAFICLDCHTTATAYQQT